MSGSYFSETTDQNGSNNPNWKGGRPKCIDCSKQLKSYYATRCKKCNAKLKIKKYYCKDCNKQLSKYRAIRCIKCENKTRIGKKRPSHSKLMKELWTKKEYRDKNPRDGEHNSMYGKKHSKETIKKILKNSRRYNSPNKLEKDFISLLNNLKLSKYKFTGNGTFIIDRFNPDFVCEKDRKIIELYGDYWHKNDKRHNNRINTYITNNYDVLVIYESQFRKNKKEVLDEITRFEKLEVY